MLATPGQLLVNEALPPDLRDYSRTLGQDEINSLLGQLAREHPEQYRKVCWRLVQLGRNAAFDEGSTITLNDLVPVVDKQPLLDEVKRQEKAIRSDSRLTDEQKDDAIETLYGEATKRLTEETYKNALANNNPFAIQAKYKARGNKSQLGAMLTSPGTYTDSNGKLVPIFIGSAYSEGLKPHEYWAASYGARLGVTCLTPDTKIVMADWSEREIGSVRPGDMVMGARSDGTIYPVRVKRFFDNGVQPVYRWTFRCASSQAITEVKATAEHKLLAGTASPDAPSTARLVRLGDIGRDDVVHGRLQDSETAIDFRIRSNEFLGNQHVVDIEVDSPDHMFLLANGIISSNSTKLGTQKGGYLSKAMNSAAIEQVVTEDDCGTKAGMPVDVNDDDSIGAVLQEDVAGFKPGTVITKPVLDKIRATKVDEIVVRSPITCGCRNGLCKRCVGMRETGRFPDIGYNVGINAASALGEQIAQNSLNCLVEGTLVRMADGSSKPIEDIEPGEYVLGSDMQGNLAPTRVVDRYDNGFQPCVDTKFIVNGTHHKSAGIHLLSTTEHPILGTRFVSGQKDAVLNWVPRMLKVGMRSKHFYAYGPSSFDDTGYKHEPLAALLGALVGDGRYTKSVNGVHLSCADESEVRDLNKSIAGLGVRLNKLRYHDGIYYRVSAGRANADRLGNPVKNYLIKHGMYGKYAHDKDVPPDIWQWDNASVAAFIGGFAAADGSVYRSAGRGKSGVSLTSTSAVLLDHLRALLLVRFGVMTSELAIVGRAGTRSRNHDQYQFTITKAAAVRRFAQAITIPGVKQRRLTDMVAAYGKGKRESVMAFARVAQTPIGIRHVYDLEVACDSHIYLLENGLIVHNTKHSGKRSDLGAYVGFDPLKNLATMPAEYDSKASVATSDGTVRAIIDAPQGGQYVELDDGDRVYVPPSLKPTVKVGDVLEAGDAVSSGLVSPADVVAYKGVGEGRRYFANRFTKVFRDSHYGVNRRNVEVVARALVNNVKVDNPDSEGDALPGDVVRYSAWASGYQPRVGAEELPLAKSVGRYLERPVLHYTIGTRVTPNVVKSLKKHKVESLLTNTSAPGVEPYAVGVVEAPAYSGDWMARLGTSYLKDRLLEDAQRGGHSELHGVNPIPGMAKGVELGRDMSTKGEY